MVDNDLEYLLRRAGEEKQKASESTCELAQRAHLGLAAGYEAKLRGEAVKSPSQPTGSQAH